MQKTKKKENGITLIALVVTVIVILILASVTLNILFDEGLIDKTHEAANSVNYSQDNEMTQLNVLMGYIRNGTGYTPGSGSSGGGSGGGSGSGSGSSGGGTVVSGNTGGEVEYNPGIYPTDGSWDEGKRVNSPKLLEGMTGVYWDSNGNEITVISNNAGNWYDYSNQKWANAKTSDGSYWVWIPRFAYRITSGCRTGSTGTIMISFLQGTSDLDSSGSTLSRVYPSVSSGTMANYVIHPAFTNGTDNNYKNGEWDEEITGFWVAKYALSRADSTSVNIGNIATFKSVPNRRIATNITIGNAYTYGINYDSSKNSHMTKNSERGALYYLTISGYGVNGEQPLENSCSGFVSGAGAGIDESTGYYINSSYDYNLQNFYQKYSYNTPAGKLTSSTGNMSGVYDLFTIWDKSEFTSAYIPEGTTWSTGPSTGETTGLSTGSSFATVTSRDPNAYKTASTKYCTVYPCGTLSKSEPYTMTVNLTYSSILNESCQVLVPGNWTYDSDAWIATANSYMYGDSVLETRGWWFGLEYNTNNAYWTNNTEKYRIAFSTIRSTSAMNSVGTAVITPFNNSLGNLNRTRGGVFFGGYLNSSSANGGIGQNSTVEKTYTWVSDPTANNSIYHERVFTNVWNSTYNTYYYYENARAQYTYFSGTSMFVCDMYSNYFNLASAVGLEAIYNNTNVYMFNSYIGNSDFANWSGDYSYYGTSSNAPRCANNLLINKYMNAQNAWNSLGISLPISKTYTYSRSAYTIPADTYCYTNGQQLIRGSYYASTTCSSYNLYSTSVLRFVLI